MALSSRQSQKQTGFTIVELLIVIVVIGILAAITIVSYTGIQKQASVAVLRSDLKNAQVALDIIKIETGSFPESEAALEFSGGTNPEYTSDGSAYCLTVSSIAAQASFYLDSAAGSIKDGKCSNHEGYSGGDIALNQPGDCPTGFIPVPGNDLFGTQGGFCVMKYEAKNVGGVATSTATGGPWVNISQTSAITTAAAACSGCHLISEAEWLTIAHDVLSVPGNWSTGIVGSGYIFSGHSDNVPANALPASSSDSDGYASTGNSSGNQRRTLTLTNGEVIWDLAGNVYDWTSGQANGGQPGASGYAWSQWSDVIGTGSLSPNPHPGFGTPAASGWDSSNGIGRLYSSSSELSARAFSRGGHWDLGSYAGIFALLLRDTPSYASSGIGFRAVK